MKVKRFINTRAVQFLTELSLTVFTLHSWSFVDQKFFFGSVLIKHQNEKSVFS